MMSLKTLPGLQNDLRNIGGNDTVVSTQRAASDLTGIRTARSEKSAMPFTDRVTVRSHSPCARAEPSVIILSDFSTQSTHNGGSAARDDGAPVRRE